MPCSVQSDSCGACPNRAYTEWRDLTPENLAKLEAGMRPNDYAPGEVLYHQGDEVNGVFCIKSGLIGERHVEADGHSMLVRLHQPGSTVGYQEFLTKGTYRNTAEVMQQSHACFIDRATITELLIRDPSVGQRFLQRSLKDTEDMEKNYVASKTMDLRRRLLHLILVLYERFGREELDGSGFLKVPIAKKDLAELAGTVPETLSRTIKKLRTENLVVFSGNDVVIPDLEAVLDEIYD